MQVIKKHKHLWCNTQILFIKCCMLCFRLSSWRTTNIPTLLTCMNHILLVMSFGLSWSFLMVGLWQILSHTQSMSYFLHATKNRILLLCVSWKPFSTRFILSAMKSIVCKVGLFESNIAYKLLAMFHVTNQIL